MPNLQQYYFTQTCPNFFGEYQKRFRQPYKPYQVTVYFLTKVHLSLDKAGRLIGKNTSINSIDILVNPIRSSSITFGIYYNKDIVLEFHQEKGAFSKIRKI